AHGDRNPVHLDARVLRVDALAEPRDCAVDRYPSVGDQQLRGAPRAETGAGKDLLEPLTLGAAAGLPGRRPGRHLRVGRGVVGYAQTTFERVDDVGRGNEVTERRQVGERVEAEPLEEL